MNSPREYSFAAVPRADIPRSTFNRSHGHKTTFNENQLIPIYVDEALPGDTFSLKSTFFGRLSTPIVPIMDNLYMDVFYFFVPNRLLWVHWVNMMGEQANPGDASPLTYAAPLVTTPAGGWAALSLADYFGLPTLIPGSASALAFPFRAYNRIWNDWFRDENLQNSVPVDTGDGSDLATDYVIKSRGKRHDYFTSALPWPIKFAAPTIPLTGQPVIRTSASALVTGTQTAMTVTRGDTGGAPAANVIMGMSGSTVLEGTNALTASGHNLYPSNLYADLSGATVGVTINQLRQSVQIQRLQERDARGGTRYTEIVRSHFGVVSPDARLQRPEFLGGGTVRVHIAPIPQNSATGLTGGSTPQGNLAAFGTVAGGNIGFTKSFTEHGVLMGLVQLRADLNYQQGMNKMWLRSSRYDWYWPALSHLGEQTIVNTEIYTQGTAGGSADGSAFGYQERWAEYRYYPSLITGQFRSTAATPLDVWHLAQKFTVLPTLGDTFIQDNPPISRVVATPSQPRVILDSFFQIRATRPMPLYSVPGLLDHF